MKTEDELVREAESVKDTGKELVGLTRVRARVAKDPKMVRTVRMSDTEYKIVSDAAKARGTDVGDFLRTAALAAARGEQSLDVELIAKSWGETQVALSSFVEKLTEAGVEKAELPGTFTHRQNATLPNKGNADSSDFGRTDIIPRAAL